MTFKIEIFSLVTKMNLKNGNETESFIFHWLQNTKIFQWSSIFQFHCKSDHKQVNWNKMKENMCKSDSISPYSPSGTLIKGIWNVFLDKIYPKNEW